jgi:hypothetical protein
VTTNLTPDRLRYLDLQEYYEDLQVSVHYLANAWENDLENLKEALENLEEANEQAEALEKRLKGLLKNGELSIRTARRCSKYPCRNCGKPISTGDEYIQRSQYAVHQERWNYTHWHTKCPR